MNTDGWVWVQSSRFTVQGSGFGVNNQEPGTENRGTKGTKFAGKIVKTGKTVKTGRIVKTGKTGRTGGPGTGTTVKTGRIVKTG